MRTVFANNIIQGGGVAASIDGPYTGAVWRDNIIWQTAGPGAMPAGSYREAKPASQAAKALTPELMLRMIRTR